MFDLSFISLTGNQHGSETKSGGIMGDDNVWDVDRVAAAELLALLKAAPEAEWDLLSAKAFSKTRLQNYEWAARRVHGSAIKVLEKEATEVFPRRDMVWTDGYRHAEHCLMNKSPSQLLGLTSHPAKSKGQILRGFIRSARQGLKSSTLFEISHDRRYNS
ncbi:hypothetical protein OIK40_01575 [Erythrobacter sp. sf7]|uniref:Uncharacterized protein n=1 Tax=Erythrobacter fulvus TaxID=2987523 RepID=A0ABT5JMG3_9SPHN|nr:hypothetical protein [Erythrobacter fulvus]MDC8753328.1 hypothetical protein [Erythrobacter fulvus]